MSEVSFAKSFLTALDTKAQKLTADHVEDARSYPARTPYILPRMPKPMSKKTSMAPGQERSVTVAVKSLRNPPLDIKLPAQSLTTSMLDVKSAVSAQTDIPADKLKLLHKKKPVSDAKVLKDLVSDGDTIVELSVMVLGGAVPTKREEQTAAQSSSSGGVVAQGLSGDAVLQTEAFWSDLRGFLQQRIRDEQTANEVLGQFRAAWSSSR